MSSGDRKLIAVTGATGNQGGGLAEARLIRSCASPILAVPPHDGELVFGFVLEGSVRLEHGEAFPLGPADSCRERHGA